MIHVSWFVPSEHFLILSANQRMRFHFLCMYVLTQKKQKANTHTSREKGKRQHENEIYYPQHKGTIQDYKNYYIIKSENINHG